ncbi:MAG: MFS transporter [Candidatus Gastranaerophilales bacterium]|nr:MFS transporter [Candidatus Gastranaerophilales bacterium]
MSSEDNLRKFSSAQLLNFCIGFFGLQFAWQMRIILSGPLTESLGASPLLYGLIWLAGPVTGIVVQPIIGALSDNTFTKFGRRVPYLFFGALFGALGLILLPKSADLSALFGSNQPVWLPLFIAAIFIWMIDACVNAAQGPYRALIPDNIQKRQHSIANSFFSFAIGVGSVVAAGAAPFLKWAFNYQMSVDAQFTMAGVAFILGMLWTCITFRENIPSKEVMVEHKLEAKKTASKPFIENVKEFLNASPEVGKICLIQFFTWIGLMSLLIFFPQYVVHIVYGVPNTAGLPENIIATFKDSQIEAQNFSSICFAFFNLICFIVAIPVAKMAEARGNKSVHACSLLSMAVAYLLIACTVNKAVVFAAIGLAGIGWASTLSLPFAMLSKYIKEGTEGSAMGIFNIFISAPQVLVCTLLAWFINRATFQMGDYTNNHWDFAFLFGALMLIVSAFVTLTIKEKEE